MTISDKLQELLDIKQEIKTAIENKDVDLTGIDFGGYAEKISDISGGITYADYARTFYLALGKLNQFATAWEHSLTVVTINRSQYPNGETEGVIIPQGVTAIGGNAFEAWSSNNQPLIIPNSVTIIAVAAFNAWLENNQPLIIPNSVTSLGYAAFSSWYANTHPLVIPDSVMSIGVAAFQNWALVPYVEILAITPPTLANISAFGDQNDAPIYVPDESVEAYKTATNWVSLADRIFSINDK